MERRHGESCIGGLERRAGLPFRGILGTELRGSACSCAQLRQPSSKTSFVFRGRPSLAGLEHSREGSLWQLPAAACYRNAPRRRMGNSDRPHLDERFRREHASTFTIFHRRDAPPGSRRTPSPSSGGWPSEQCNVVVAALRLSSHITTHACLAWLSSREAPTDRGPVVLHFDAGKVPAVASQPMRSWC